MAAKKRKAVKKPVKKAKRAVKAVRKAVARKAPARKAAAMPKAAPKKAKRPAKKAIKKATRREFGEGNYKASKRFREGQETFVTAHKAEIPALGKAAEAALAGPEGESLRAAEAEAAGHAAAES